MQLYKHNTSHDGTHKQARGRSVDAAMFVEELVEIYNTPTPNAMVKAGKIVLIVCSSFFYNKQGPIFISPNLNMNPTQIRLIYNF